MPFRCSSLAWLPLLALAGAAPAAPAPPTSKELGRAIDAYVRPLVRAGHLSGQLLVARHGAVVVERSYGFANREREVFVTPETRFNVASLTKPMTGVVAIQLIQEKRLGLRDSVAKWIAGFPSGDRITVEHLLQHRSGIPHQVMPDSALVRPMTAAEVVERAKKDTLDFPPGTRSSYSGGGFSVLARVLELASGESYAELLEERVFGPLGMTSSGHVDSRHLLPHSAASYLPGPGGIEKAPFQDYSGLVGASSVWSTARDLHRFVQGLVGGKLGAGPRASYAGGGKVDFNGRTNGFMAWAVWDSASGVEVVFAGNLHTGAPELLKSALPRLAAGETLAPPTLPALASAAPPRAELERVMGVYRFAFGLEIDLHLVDGALYSNDWILLPTKDGSFFSPRDYGEIKPVFGADGKAERIDWKQGSEVYPAPRVVAGKLR